MCFIFLMTLMPSVFFIMERNEIYKWFIYCTGMYRWMSLIALHCTRYTIDDAICEDPTSLYIDGICEHLAS